MADNPSSKFKFVSPGVFVNEIDNSQLPETPSDVGPVVIGTARKGPGMVPIKINSFSDFVDTFGEPVAGTEPGDIWRNGNLTAPTYGAYAAQAWLRNSAPLTYVRLLGDQSDDALASGKAGFKAGTLNATPAAGGAWGLFVSPSGSLYSGSTAPATLSGALAAVFYCHEGRVFLSGNRVDNVLAGKSVEAAKTGSACELYEISNDTYTISVTKDGTIANQNRVEFSLTDPNKKNFIRKVFNTNPTITNQSITSQNTLSASQGGLYWLGQSYERFLTPHATSSIGVLGSTIATKAFAFVAPLRNQNPSSTTQFSDFQFGSTKGTTGFFIGQNLTGAGGATGSFNPKNQQKLFRLEAITSGQSTQESIKVSIANIKAPRGEFEKYGTFSVLLRKLSDTDAKPVIVERFDNINLNPASENFIAKVIGDKYQEYDTKRKNLRTYGQYDNRSKYVRVVMTAELERGTLDPEYLPFGVFGPLKPRDVSTVSGSGGFRAAGASRLPVSSSTRAEHTLVDANSTAAYGAVGGHSIYLPAVRKSMGLSFGVNMVSVAAGDDKVKFPLSMSLSFPSVPLRTQSTWGRPKANKTVFWGAWTGRSATDPRMNEGLVDLLRPMPAGQESSPSSTSHDICGIKPCGGEVALASSDPLQIAWCFTLDNVSGSFLGGSTVATSGTYEDYFYRNGESISYKHTYTGTLDAGYAQFTTVLHGGFDGFDIRERDPFRMSTAFADASNEDSSYQLHTLRKAVNLVSDAEQVEMNLASMPGITHNGATEYLLDTCEDRGDALAVIDIQKVYTPDTENASAEADRNAFTVQQAADTLKDRDLNTSYGATYYPWVRIRDSISNRTLWAPPSIAAIGAYSSTDNKTAPWFAPAGFARGGLTDGAAGIPVLDVSRRLTSDERDTLYQNNINPIAKFPAEGIVIFGQKTLQQTRSALDRINVRRLMIFLKREISFIASRLLFAPNVPDTWARFTGQATPILDKVKAQFGIDEFRLILDETTTTPDLIDQNIIYAKLLVKPTKSVEFFAIDFVVTNSGAAFED